tara:strand:- start:497 stop:781 length:285 start_codon:yes stop_codon:yes gene_type:complete
MKKFNSIEEIRDKIDSVDLKILELISERKRLVDNVVKLKTREQIIDKERIKYILEKLSFEAKKKGLPESLVNELWESMIKNFIKYEQEVFDKKR